MSFSFLNISEIHLLFIIYFKLLSIATASKLLFHLYFWLCSKCIFTHLPEKPFQSLVLTSFSLAVPCPLKIKNLIAFHHILGLEFLKWLSKLPVVWFCLHPLPFIFLIYALPLSSFIVFFFFNALPLIFKSPQIHCDLFSDTGLGWFSVHASDSLLGSQSH